jgi:ABC-type amino acid transport substrate-binding protein
MRRRHLLAALPLFATGLIKASAARAAPVLRVGAALPDPPFEFNAKDGPAGFDITLMQRIAGMIGREWQLVPYKSIFVVSRRLPLCTAISDNALT